MVATVPPCLVCVNQQANVSHYGLSITIIENYYTPPHADSQCESSHGNLLLLLATETMSSYLTRHERNCKETGSNLWPTCNCLDVKLCLTILSHGVGLSG